MQMLKINRSCLFLCFIIESNRHDSKSLWKIICPNLYIKLLWRKNMQDVMVIGIAGGSGSGKTTLAENIIAVFNDEIIILCHDYYYESNEELSLEERKKLNYDHPDSFETDLLIYQLKELKQFNTIYHPVYSFVKHTRVDETVEVKPTKVIIIEGILIFENKELCDLMDMKVFVDTDGDVRIIRRLLRDVKERGRDLDSVV